MGDGKLDWWWFDPLQCWGDLHELWEEWELRNNLMHHSWTRKAIWGGEGEDGFALMHELGSEEGTDWPSFPCNTRMRAQPVNLTVSPTG